MEKTKFKKLRLNGCEQMYYCHNKKCGFYNCGLGTAGLEESEGKIAKCDLCRKFCFETEDGTGNYGDIEKVDI